MAVDYEKIVKYLYDKMHDINVMENLGNIIEDAVKDDNAGYYNVGQYVTEVLTHYSNNEEAVKAAIDMFSAITGWSLEDVVDRLNANDKVRSHVREDVSKYYRHFLESQAS